jgi:hypothetical protein
MGTHVSISGPEAADRLAIRELVDANAHCADRRDAKGHLSLFTRDAHYKSLVTCLAPGISFSFRMILSILSWLYSVGI